MYYNNKILIYSKFTVYIVILEFMLAPLSSAQEFPHALIIGFQIKNENSPKFPQNFHIVMTKCTYFPRTTSDPLCIARLKGISHVVYIFSYRFTFRRACPDVPESIIDGLRAGRDDHAHRF